MKTKPAGAYKHTSKQERKNKMKLNKKTVKAIKARKIATSKTAKAKIAKLVLPIKGTFRKAIALILGARGKAGRAVEMHTTPDKRTFIRATQNHLSANFIGQWCEIVNGILTGERAALVELGAYVNGKVKGAKVVILNDVAAFKKAGHSAMIHWRNTDDNGIAGHYIGNPNQKGMVAVCVEYSGKPYVWQIEQDSNANNRHERGLVTPLKEGVKLAVC